MELIAEETWASPTFWTGVVREFGVPILVIFALGFLIAVVLLAAYLASRRVYNDFQPIVKEKFVALTDGHKHFMDTAAASIDLHAKSNASHASTHAITAESLRAIATAVEEGVDASRDRISDLVNLVHGGIDAVAEGLEEMETIHKDNPPMLKAIARFRVRLAGLSAVRRPWPKNPVQ